MDTNKLLEDLSNEDFKIDTIKLQILLFRYLIKADIKQDVILKKQIEIKEMLLGKTGQELEESILLKLEKLFEHIDDEYSVEYFSQIQKVIL